MSAKIETTEALPIDGIPSFEKTVSGCDPLPEGYDLYIVSALYASAYEKTYGKDDRLYLVADPVMSDDASTFRGCRGIAKAF